MPDEILPKYWAWGLCKSCADVGAEETCSECGEKFDHCEHGYSEYIQSKMSGEEDVNNFPPPKEGV